MAAASPWYRTRRGIAVVTLYGVLTMGALFVSTEPSVLGETLLDVDPSTTSDGDVTVPFAVYLYGYLGAMAYAFTSIVAKFERGTTGVIRVGIRTLAALPLAAGVFILAGALGVPASSGSLVAGVAFLVGLYVNLTLKALGGLADRLYGRASGPGADPGSAADSSDGR